MTRLTALASLQSNIMEKKGKFTNFERSKFLNSNPVIRL